MSTKHLSAARKFWETTAEQTEKQNITLNNCKFSTIVFTRN